MISRLAPPALIGLFQKLSQAKYLLLQSYLSLADEMEAILRITYEEHYELDQSVHRNPAITYHCLQIRDS